MPSGRRQYKPGEWVLVDESINQHGQLPVKRQIEGAIYSNVASVTDQSYSVRDAWGIHRTPVCHWQIAGKTEPPDLPEDRTVEGLMEWLER